MEYVSTRSGLLAVGQVKTGDTVIILDETKSTFSDKQQKTYWNCKVSLPNGEHKIAGLMESTCDEMSNKWGTKTENWIGHTLKCEIKMSKAGNEYILLKTTDEPVVDVNILKIESEVAPTSGQEYPENTGDEIPF
jgi:hypothetical protein